VRSFKIGEMVEYLNDIDAGAGSVGIVTERGVYEGFPVITFISGPDSGKTYAVNYGALRHMEEEEPAAEPLPYKVESPVYDNSARRPVIKHNIRLPVEQKPVSDRKVWTRAQVANMIEKHEGAVERGVLCLNKHAALLPEKTREFVAFWTKWVEGGNALSGKHLVNARRTCLFNVKVLVQAANGEI
jgi:hypothetical protein